MSAGARLFTLLQHGDSLFPSGLTSFSWGLEQLFEEGRVPDATAMKRFVEAQLRLRWATFDRAFLSASHAAAGRLGLIAELDDLCAASIPAKELREGSSRAGRALLAVHAKLNTVGAADYRTRLAQSAGEGHLPVMQGMVWRAVGLAESDAALLSAYGLVAGFAAAAIRLGLIGHVDSQRIIGAVAGTVEELALLPPPAPDQAATFTPAADIAAMRHEAAAQRLFAN
jgi:urease accessory protein